MKIKDYYDIDLINKISKDEKWLQSLCNEDNGFIFERLKDCEIFPDKEIVKKINSHAAIIFLFNNYPISEKEKIEYSAFLKDDSLLMKIFDTKNITSKETVMNIFSSENSGFNIPSFLLKKDDFIKYEDLIVKAKMSPVRDSYLVESFLFLSKEDREELPLSILSKHLLLYCFSFYLFEQSEHLENYRNNINHGNCYLHTLIEYVKIVNDISIISNLYTITEDDMKKIYFIFKERDDSFTINHMFPYVDRNAKIEIIKNDYTGDFNPNTFIDTYINNVHKLKEDFGYNYLELFKDIKVSPVFDNYLKLQRLFKEKDYLYVFYSSNKYNLNSCLQDKLINMIDLSQIESAPVFFRDQVCKLKEIKDYCKNTDKDFYLLAKKNLETNVSLYYEQVFKNNNSLINYIHPKTFDIIHRNTKPSLNKFIWMCTFDNDNNYKKELKKELKELPKEFHNDLLSLLDKIPIPFNSLLFKADCVLKMKEINGVKYLNKAHMKILIKEDVISYFNNDALVEDNVWLSHLNNFNKEYIFDNWQLDYFKKNYKNKDNGPILIKLIQKIKKEHIDKDLIFKKENIYNLLVAEVFSLSSQRIEFISKNKELYIKNKQDLREHTENFSQEHKDLIIQNKKIRKINSRFERMSLVEQSEIIKLMKPESFFAASVFTEIIGKEIILRDYVISKINVKEYERDFTFKMLPDCILVSLIIPDFWKKQDNENKENIFINVCQCIGHESFSNIVNLINFNEPNNDLEKKLKDYTIKNHAERLLYNPYQSDKVWKYNMEDLYHMFKCLDDGNNWNFEKPREIEFADYVKIAINNSSTDMFWKVLEYAKYESPAIYTMLANPLAIHDQIKDNGFLFDEFSLFKEDFLKENKQIYHQKEHNDGVSLSPYTFIYEFIDLDILAKGIDSIRNSFAKGILNDYENKSYSNRGPFDDDFNIKMFPHLHKLYYYNISSSNKVDFYSYLSNEKLEFIVNSLLNLDLANINIICSFQGLLPLYGKDKMTILACEKIKDVKDVNSLFLKELSYANYEENKHVFRKVCSSEKNINSMGDVYQNAFENFAKQSPENAAFLSYICKEEKNFDLNFNNKMSLNGNFVALDWIKMFPFGLQIHAFSEDFSNSSKLQKIIKEEIGYIVDVDNPTSVNDVFKL